MRLHDFDMHEAVPTGYEPVETAISCLLTRFKVRSAWDLFRFYLLFRRVRAGASKVSGQLAAVFLIEDFHTCYTLSLWRDPTAILEFNGEVTDHVSAANWAIPRLRWTSAGPLLWSAQFRLSAISPHNLLWENFDLRALVPERDETSLHTQAEGK